MLTRQTKLGISITAGILLAILAVLVVLPASASDSPSQAVYESIQAAPAAQRAAPYGQYLLTHNSASITTTANYGTVAKTAGYDPLKAIYCDVGVYDVTLDVYARTSSTGGVYTISTGTVLPANTKTISNFTQIAPWMSLRLTSEVTGSTTTCGIWAQTP